MPPPSGAARSRCCAHPVSSAPCSALMLRGLWEAFFATADPSRFPNPSQASVSEMLPEPWLRGRTSRGLFPDFADTFKRAVEKG